MSQVNILIIKKKGQLPPFIHCGSAIYNLRIANIIYNFIKKINYLQI
jgi:hypothetical protein